jgi:hypothetical protein
MAPLDLNTIIQGGVITLLCGIGAVIYRTSLELTRIGAVLDGMKALIENHRENHSREIDDLRQRLDAALRLRHQGDER